MPALSVLLQPERVIEVDGTDREQVLRALAEAVDDPGCEVERDPGREPLDPPEPPDGALADGTPAGGNAFASSAALARSTVTKRCPIT